MILNKTVTPCEGEISIKTYLCTAFNSFLFGIKANGYVEVTNKRLLFQALGTGTLKSPSVIHSEVPISKVVGINIYKGKAFNLLRLLAGFLLTMLITFVTGLLTAFVLSFLDDSPVIYQMLVWTMFLAAIFFAYIYNKTGGTDDDSLGLDAKDDSLKELAIAALGLGAMLSLVKGAMGYRDIYGSAKIAIPVCLVAFIYMLYRYSKKPAFSLMVHSKSGSNAIVRIAGPAPMGIGSAASKALTAKPAKDSMLVLKELGALVTDIQNNGDFGIEKWAIK